MVRLYGRDHMSEPLRQLGHVLLWIAAGDFRPDETRSGCWTRHPSMRVEVAPPGESAATVMISNLPPCSAEERHAAALQTNFALVAPGEVTSPWKSPEMARGGIPVLEGVTTDEWYCRNRTSRTTRKCRSG